MKLLHQCGHCTKWNIDSFVEDECGDGLIFSPVHEKKSRIQGFPSKVLKRSLFDPQYYLPNSQKAKLHTYDFFPEVAANGFETLDFTLIALESAKKCIEFQLGLEAEKIVIPARYFSQMDPDYTSKQDAYTVHPFLREAGRQKVKKPLLLTLPVTSHMVENEPFRINLLNWVTSFPEINGVYLIPEHTRGTKQILSEQYLFELLRMITEIRAADLDVCVGYSNTESLLLLVTGDVDITMGAYENTRMFSLDKFVESEEERRGPKARIYLPGLLNWVQFNQAEELRDTDEDIWNAVYEETEFAESKFGKATEPHFAQPELYRHYFIVFAKQVDALRSLSKEERYQKLRQWLKAAIKNDEAIRDAQIDFERHGRGDHLQHWLNVLNKYSKAYLS